MPYYQNSALTVLNTQCIGGFAVYTAATAGASWTNLGLCRAISVTEELTKYNSQASNGPDPVEGVARQEVVATFELIEWTPANWDTMRGGNLDTETAATASTYITGTPTANTISSGGKNELGFRAYKFVNTKFVSGSTTQTVFVIYKGYVDTGISFTVTSDNSEDPITVIPWTIRGKIDTGRTSGDQLWYFETEMGA